METPRQPPGLATLNTLARARHYILWDTDAFNLCRFDHTANPEVVCSSAGSKSEWPLLVVAVHWESSSILALHLTAHPALHAYTTMLMKAPQSQPKYTNDDGD